MVDKIVDFEHILVAAHWDHTFLGNLVFLESRNQVKFSMNIGTQIYSNDFYVQKANPICKFLNRKYAKNGEKSKSSASDDFCGHEDVWVRDQEDR